MKPWVQILIEFLKFLLVGIALYYGKTATIEISKIKNSVEVLTASPLTLPPQTKDKP